MTKRIYTLTCTWAASYGAVLQAYALATKINELGYSAKIINYQPNYYGKELLRAILASAYSVKRLLLDKLYLDFLRESGLLTTHTFKSIDDLRTIGSSIDACIVGSDQVWNCTKYYNGKDDAMFLDFVDKTVKKISYAASLSMPSVPKSQVGRYKTMLKQFNAISVRERSGAKILEDIGLKNISVVIDPVYLLSKLEWSKVASRSKVDLSSEKYILAICLEDRDEVYEYAQRKAKHLGVKLYTLKNGIRGLRHDKRADKSYGNISVYDYLNIVKNAQGIIADSFHAMSFSLIFNVNIDIIPRNDHGNSRMVDLLSDFGISNRIVHDGKLISDNIDFKPINTLISKQVDIAKSYLINAIEE